MSAMYMSQLSTTLPLMEVDHRQDHHHHQGHFQAFTLPKNPPILVPFVINNSSPSDSSLIYGSDHNLRQHQAILEHQHMIGGSSSVFATPFPTVESIRDEMIERSSYDPYDIEKLQATNESVKTGKWSTAPAAAKMRITRKASDPGVRGAAKKPRRRAQSYEDHNHRSSGSSMNQPLGVIRVCSDCNTTKTPLWRSGPCGPKSLCNACGIRQRKARRSMMASGVSTDGAKVGTTCDAATAHPKVKKEKRADADRSLPFKKRCKLVVQDHPAATAAAADDKATVKSAEVVVAVPTMDLVDSIGVNWGKSSAAAAACFRPSPAFAVQDEITDAAMLLMTLSCGLVRS